MKATKIHEAPSAELLEVRMERNLLASVQAMVEVTGGTWDEDE